MGPHALKMRPMFVAHVGVCASGLCECGEEFFGPGRGETYRSPTEVANAWARHLQDIQRRARAIGPEPEVTPPDQSGRIVDDGPVVPFTTAALTQPEENL